jgi:hypothetical protein
MSVAEPPVLSVIIPVWNGARYLDRPIQRGQASLTES